MQVRGRPSPTPTDDPFGWLADATRLRDVVRWSRGIFGVEDKAGTAPIDAVEFDATDVHVDDLLVGTVAVRIDGVRLEPTVPFPDVVTGAIGFDVRTTRAQVLAWIGRFFPDWDIRPHDHELVGGARSRLALPAAGASDRRPAHRAHGGGGCGGPRPRDPTAAVLGASRSFAVPPVDPALDLESVTVDGDDVALGFRHEGVRQRLHLDAVRAAVRDGATKLGSTIFG